MMRARKPLPSTLVEDRRSRICSSCADPLPKVELLGSFSAWVMIKCAICGRTCRTGRIRRETVQVSRLRKLGGI